MRGRKPTPTAIKKINGNPGKRALSKSEPTPPPGVPQCPEYVSDKSRKVWFELSSTVVGMDLLTMADAVSFEVLCNAIAQYREAIGEVVKYGAVVDSPSGEKKSPWLLVAKDAEQVINVYGSKFGLSPSDRARLGATKDKQVDPLQAFLDKGKQAG